MSNINTTKEKLHEYAARMRCNPTPEEAIFRDGLDKLGLTYSSQQILGCYIVDFYVRNTNGGYVIIEIDGGRHFTPEGIERDRIRDRELGKRRNHRIWHIPNEKIYNWTWVYKKMRKYALIPKKQQSRHRLTTPSRPR